MKYILKFAIVILSFICNNSFAQTDTEFWFAAPEVSQSGSSNLDRGIVLRLTSYSVGSTVTISQPAGGTLGMPPQTVFVPANSTQTVNLTSWIDAIEVKPANTVLNYGIKITADNPITAYYEVISGGTTGPANNPEAFVLKGANALGDEFWIPSQDLVPNHSSYSPTPYNSFDIVATQNNTTVTITPSNAISGHPASVSFNITLQAGQTYSATATSQAANRHLNGSKVVSDKPIAITVKDDLLNGNLFQGNCADLTGDQIVPMRLIGTEYIAIRGKLDAPNDHLFITATQNGTDIFRDGNPTPIATINEGATFSFSMGTAGSTYITTNNPAYVWQLTGSGCEFGSAILPQIKCTGSSKVSYVRSSNLQLYINLLVPATGESNFTVNGTPLSATLFSNVPGTAGSWKWASVLLPLSTYPQGTIISVVNSSHKFHLSTIDINGGGTSYGYFSDYSTAEALATATPNPACIGQNIQLLANSVPGASYTWNGPGFFSTLQNPIISGASFSNAGTYVLTVDAGGCKATDTLNVSVIRCPKECIVETGYSININNPYTLNFWAVGNPPGGTYDWSFGDGSPNLFTAVGSVSHMYSGPGSYTVIVTYTSPNGQKCEKRFDICIAKNDIRNFERRDNTHTPLNGAGIIGDIYPNPANTILNIPFIQNEDIKSLNQVEVFIMTIDGKVVSKYNTTHVSNNLISLSINNLKEGFYLCKVTTAGTTITKKFIKKMSKL